MSVAQHRPAHERLQSGVDLLVRRRFGEAAEIFRGLIADHPGLADPHRLLGLALRELRDELGAEAALRAALQRDPSSGPTAVPLSEMLLEQGRGEEALAVISPLAASEGADLHVLTANAAALKRLGRLEEARNFYERAVNAAPGSGVAEHNLASVLGDLELFADSEAGSRRALAKGLDAPETWLVRARALVGLNRHREAEEAYRELLSRRPGHVVGHGELAQLLWMQTGDAWEATAELRRVSAIFPTYQGLALKRAELLEYAGDLEGAYAIMAPIVAAENAEPMMHVVAARLATRLDPIQAVVHAKQGLLAAPDNRIALAALCQAHLAAGDVDAAAPIAVELNETAPLDQHALGLLTTVWRLRGDDRYRLYCDHARLVGTSTIDTPEGWPSLESYLSDLERSLEKFHAFKTHPIGQSVRHGSQTSQSLTKSDDPVIQAFFGAIDGPIRRHIRALGSGDDPLRSRRLSDYALNGVWSVRLHPRGYHADHLHPMGWLSSACYISLPAAIDRGREGWLKFGEPGIRTRPELAPEHFVRPEPGLLVLFPSYMWHGTVPFSGDDTRLTIAFDVIPR